MKYSAVVLACVLAVAAAAEYNNGQYIPEKQNNNRYNQYRPSRYQQYQNNAYVSSTPYPSQFVSSTPYPSQFVSSTSVPVTAAPARSTIYYSSSTPKPVFNIPAIPARSVSVEAPTPSVESAAPAWSSRASWPSASSESVKPELPVSSTQAPIYASVSPSVAPAVAEVEAPVVSVVPAARFYPAAQVAPAAPVISVTPVAPVAQVYQQAKIALPTARWAGDARAAETLRYSNQINSDGAFQYSYETNNGIVAEEQGSPRSFYSGEDQVAPIVAQGSFGWTSPEGQQITISYVADESGYHPTGSAIPEVPPQIARALAYIASRNLQA
ncbi:protein PRRC2C-like [Aricia agestis]|uniref:protein PRRC2C-like n=1 Tax=Aricia agestis TaxID=91739 RepID=UPI001C201B03|nr:protein PRRC2C-like [Aricia agestis]